MPKEPKLSAEDEFKLGEMLAQEGDTLPLDASANVIAGFASVASQQRTEPEILPLGTEEPVAPVLPPTTGPVPIVDIEDTVKAAPEGKPLKGTGFFFGEVMTHKFADGTQYAVTRNRAYITDKTLIKNLRKAAVDHPNHKIFPDS